MRARRRLGGSGTGCGKGFNADFTGSRNSIESGLRATSADGTRFLLVERCVMGRVLSWLTSICVSWMLGGAAASAARTDACAHRARDPPPVPAALSRAKARRRGRRPTAGPTGREGRMDRWSPLTERESARSRCWTGSRLQREAGRCGPRAWRWVADKFRFEQQP